MKNSELPSWRDVMQPHPDVAEGRYRNAEFAADLAQVSRGEAGGEYQDPAEFFRRTYVTSGMASLLESAIRRVTGKGGDPVIQLKTAFGGGKTHTMLALYHLLRGEANPASLAGVGDILKACDVDSLPETHIAVLVGTALNPAVSSRPAPGIGIHTLWGELAWQLAQSAGKPELFELVAAADARGISPGSIALRNLLDGAGSCLILMDELVAYARKIWKAGGKGSAYENFLVFIQELTEAARASASSLVAASIPESDIEIGGEAGQRALEVIEHTFGRLEAIWKPVDAAEGFEVVRRRLFNECGNAEARARVCRAYSDMYQRNSADFPLSCRTEEYYRRLLACYPVHPEVFDRLYDDWATLERFQRTRGVLRLMAAVIHDLWMTADSNPLIQPGSLPLNRPAVRDELLRHLPENWNGILDHEVDGPNSRPYLTEQATPRFGKDQACRRVARTIMLGSAPDVRGQRIRGLEASRIRLGSVQPGKDISLFNDALSTLASELHHLYSSHADGRFWYDTRPTLRKAVEDRAAQIQGEGIRNEIADRLRRLARRQPPLAGVHPCPAGSGDVPDEQACRLVMLGPDTAWTGRPEANPAAKRALEILETRGPAARSYRNMLVFLAPDASALKSLEDATRRYLAWQTIGKESRQLNLDAQQLAEVEENIRETGRNIDSGIQEVWRWLLVPTLLDESDVASVRWDASRIAGNSDSLIGAAARKLVRDQQIIENWGVELLDLELERLLWRDGDSIGIEQLWSDLASYCYLPRLRDFPTLAATIRAGVASGRFGYASGRDGDGFAGLKLGESVQIEKSGILVRKQLAEQLLQAASAAGHTTASQTGEANPSGGLSEKPPVHGFGATNAGGSGSHIPNPAPQPPAEKHEFYLKTSLDKVSVYSDVKRVVEELVSLLDHEGRVELILEVQAHSDRGYKPDTVRTVSENCKTLRIETWEFSGE